MAYLTAISTTTTIPLFIRTKGDLREVRREREIAHSHTYILTGHCHTAFLSSGGLTEQCALVRQQYEYSAIVLLLCGVRGQLEVLPRQVLYNFLTFSMGFLKSITTV